MPADGQAPPLEVSIPIRYSPDGRSWGEGIVTSLTSSTLVVLSTTPPEVRSKVYFALGLGFESPTFHGEGRVTSLASPGPGVEPPPGFGLRFEGAPSDLAAAIAKLERGYPGALAVEPDGTVTWPVATAALSPRRDADAGLALWAGGRELAQVPAADSPGAVAGNGNEPLPAYVALLLRLAAPLASCHAESVLLTHRGRVLSPVTGIPTQQLAASLEALERVAAAAPAAAPKGGAAAPQGDWSLDLSDFDAPTMEIKSPSAIEEEDDDGPTVVEVLWDHPLVELVATQMRMADTLALAGWRYGRLTSDLLASLDRDRTLLDGIQLRLSASAEEAGLAEETANEIAQAVEDVGTFVTRLAWHAMAIESAAASASYYETFQIEKERLARQAAISARAAAREAAPEPKAAAKAEPPRRERDEPRKAESKPAKEKPRREERAHADAPAPRPSHEPKPPPKAGKPPKILDSAEWRKVPMWAIAVLAVSVLLAITRIGNAVRSARPPAPPPAAQVDTAGLRSRITEIAPRMALHDVAIEKGHVKLVVDSTWGTLPPKERQIDLEAISLTVMQSGYLDFVVVTPAGQLEASFAKGRFRLKDVAAPPPPDKSAER